GVATRDVAQQPREDAPAEVGVAICPDRVLAPRPPGDIDVGLRRQHAPGLGLQLLGCERSCRPLAAQAAEVDLQLAPDARGGGWTRIRRRLGGALRVGHDESSWVGGATRIGGSPSARGKDLPAGAVDVTDTRNNATTPTDLHWTRVLPPTKLSSVRSQVIG